MGRNIVKLSRQSIKDSFPIFKKNKDLVLLDSWATTQKPQCVIDSEIEFNEWFYWAVGRWSCVQSITATEKYEQSREIVASFIWAKKENLSFNAWATEWLNALVYWVKHLLKKWDEILLSAVEHNSNILPWIRLSQDIWIKLKFVKFNQKQEICLNDIESNITNKTKIISITHISNVTGQILPIAQVWKIAKKRNILFFVDACQSAPHIQINVNKLNASWLVFSAHKLWWPTWIWALYLSDDLIEKINPINIWWWIVDWISKKWFNLISWIEKLETWTPPLTQSIWFASACNFLREFWYENLEKIENELLEYWTSSLKKIQWLNIIWPTDINKKSWIISFYFEKVHTHDIACALAEKNICVRSWLHCADILHQELWISWTTRISFWMYNTKKDINALVKAVKEVVEMFK